MDDGTVIGEGMTGTVSIKGNNVQKKFKDKYDSSYYAQKTAFNAISRSTSGNPSQCFPNFIQANDSTRTITMENLKGYISLTDYLTRSFPWGYEESVQKNLMGCVDKLNRDVRYNHNDLHSDNVMVNPQTHNVRIIDFSHASPVMSWSTGNDKEVIQWVFRAFHIYQVQAVMLLIWCIIGCVMLARPFRFKKWEAIIVLTLTVCILIAEYILPLSFLQLNVDVSFKYIASFLLNLELINVVMVFFFILSVIYMPKKSVITTTILNSILLFLVFGLALHQFNNIMGRTLCLQDGLCLAGIIALVIILNMTRVSKVIKTSKYTVSILLIVAIVVWMSWPMVHNKSIMDYIIVLAEASPMIYMFMSLKYSEWVDNKWIVVLLMILPVFLFCGGINLRHRKLLG